MKQLGKFMDREACTANLDTLFPVDKPLQVVAITYNKVGVLGADSLETNVDGLQIHVIAGARTYGKLSEDPLFKSLLKGEKVDPVAIREGNTAAAQAVAQGISAARAGFDGITLTPDVATLFVVYLGLVGFDEMMKVTSDVIQRYPDAHMVTVTCDCNIAKKREKLRSPRNHVDMVVEGKDCGGYVTMYEILQGIRAPRMKQS